MAQRVKNKNVVVIKNKKKPCRSSRKKVVLVHAKHPVLKHLRLIEGGHTGRMIHHRHTSHASLAIILAFLGLFIVASNNIVNAETSSGSVNVSGVVKSPAPTVGASITSPADGLNLVDQNTIEVSGTCSSSAFVVIRDNDTAVGSTICATNGTFKIKIQLFVGKNKLTAMNYDNLNQAGPKTSIVTITLAEAAAEKTAETIVPKVPTNPSITTATSLNSVCDTYDAGKVSTGGALHVAVGCVPRLLISDTTYTLGVVVWGGTAPYALSIDWGDGSSAKLYSVAEAGYRIFSFKYALPAIYNIKFYLTDSTEKTAITQTAVEVDSVTGATTTVNSSNSLAQTSASILEMTVPIYFLAVALTLGFWAGDLFDRSFGNGGKRRLAR